MRFKRMLDTLPSTVTVSSITTLCVVHPNSLVKTDLTPQARLEALPVVQADAITVSQFFSNGVAGTDYIVSWIAVYSDNEVERVDSRIMCNAYNLVGT